MYLIHEDDVTARKLPGRDHKLIIGPDNFGVKNMCFGTAIFPSGSEKAPPHTHPSEEEIIYIISGEGKIIIDGDEELLKPEMCIYVPPTLEHQLINTGKEPLKVAYVFSPPVEQGSYDPK